MANCNVDRKDDLELIFGKDVLENIEEVGNHNNHIGHYISSLKIILFLGIIFTYFSQIKNI